MDAIAEATAHDSVRVARYAISQATNTEGMAGMVVRSTVVYVHALTVYNYHQNSDIAEAFGESANLPFCTDICSLEGGPLANAHELSQQILVTRRKPMRFLFLNLVQAQDAAPILYRFAVAVAPLSVQRKEASPDTPAEHMSISDATNLRRALLNCTTLQIACQVTGASVHAGDEELK